MNKRSIIITAIVALLGSMFVTGIMAAADIGPFIDSYNVDHCHHTCNGTASKLQCSPDQRSYSGLVDSGASVAIFIGDDTVTTGNYGDTYGAGERWGSDLLEEWCITDGTSVTVHLRSGVNR